jgi:hypothetical protein
MVPSSPPGANPVFFEIVVDAAKGLTEVFVLFMLKAGSNERI